VSRGDWWTADAVTRQIICREVLDTVRARLDLSAPQIDTCTDVFLGVATTLGFTGVALWSLIEDGTLRNRGFAAATEMPLFAAQTRDLYFRPGEGMPGRTFLHGAVEWIPNVIHDDNFPRLRGAIRDLVRTVVAFPAVKAGRAVAVVEMFSRDVRERDEDTVSLFATLGQQQGPYMASLFPVAKST
jgi:hypothetical protein